MYSAKYNGRVALRRNPQRNIVLSGFYGCRSEEVGRDLARRMRRPFVSVPAEIERRRLLNLSRLTGLGQPPSDQKLAEWVIRDVSYRQSSIAVLGNNSMSVARQFDELKIFSFLVFLDPPFSALWERIERDAGLGDMVLELGRHGIYDLWLKHRAQYEFSNLQVFVPPEDTSFIAKLVAHCFFT